MVDAPNARARSIALSGRGPNEVTLECNDRLIVRRGSQLGRATAARSREALSGGFHQPGAWAMTSSGGVRLAVLGGAH